jgi:UDP-4-amino-4,6-dideoxy-N-acetyl-beta-L-altrosamine transaminase
MIPYGRQEVTDDDVEAVVAVLRSDLLTQGPVVPRFEEKVAAYTGAVHAVAMNSATSALHAACLSLGLGRGDYLWTTPITFVASANCALYCGARVDFVDIDPRTGNLSVDCLAKKLAIAEKAGELPKIVIPVHLSGLPCDMEAIHALGCRFGFRIIEDASHAIGARYRGEYIGSCRFSEITVFSFHPVKIITTGEGGMALTNDPVLAERMSLLRSHGITRDAEQMTREPDGPWYYQQIDLGFNYRMTEMQAALGISQLTRLDEYVARRHALAKRYDAALAGLPLVLPTRPSDSLSALHLYVVRLQDARKHRSVFEALRSAGIAVNLHYIPVHTQPYYEKLGFRAGQFPEAERFYTEAISLPMFPTLPYADQDCVVSQLGGLLR